MKKFFIIAALAIMAAACQKPVTPEITLSSPAEVTLETEGGIASVSFTSNVAWKATIDNSNFKVSPASGEAGTTTIKVTALANEKDDPVVANLTIQAETAKASVKFTQLQKDCLSLPVAEKEIDFTAQAVEFKVLANIDYNAVSDADWVKVTGTKGSVETTVTLDAAINKGEAREAHITVSGEGKKAEFTLKQGGFAPTFAVNGSSEDFSVEMDKAAGKTELTVETNVDYTVEAYASEYAWQTVSSSDDVHTVSIAANAGWDERSSIVTFTVPDIQVEVLDDFGEPTGETEDFKLNVYFHQEGITTTAWRTEFTWDLYNEGAGRYAIAEYGDYVAVTNAAIKGVNLYSKADGAFVKTVDLPYAPSGITNDDAGNILISTGGNYPIDESTWELIPDQQVPLQVFAVKKGEDLAGGKEIINYYDGFYGYGLNNMRVRGDVFGDAVITFASAGYGESYIVAWELNGGVVNTGESGYTDYVTFYSADGVWTSWSIIGYPLGAKMTDGIYGAGYATVDGTIEASGTYYGLEYNPGTWSHADWKYIDGVNELSQSWANAATSMDYIEWGGKKYIYTDSFSYFAYADWDYDGTADGYMPGYLYLLDVTDPAAPTVASLQQYYANPDNFQYGDSADVTLTVEDGNLVAYIIDAAASHIQKRVYPAL